LIQQESLKQLPALWPFLVGPAPCRTSTSHADGKMYPPSERTPFTIFAALISLIVIDSWIYMLIVAMDANFRLKSRLRGSFNREPILGLGWAYFVDNGPYSEFIKNYVDQDEVHLHDDHVDNKS
jgi:hypothetical protein